MSFATESLAYLQSAYQAKISGGTAPAKSYSIAGRNVEHMSLAEIRKEINYWTAKVAQENNGNVTVPVFQTR